MTEMLVALTAKFYCRGAFVGPASIVHREASPFLSQFYLPVIVLQQCLDESDAFVNLHSHLTLKYRTLPLTTEPFTQPPALRLKIICKTVSSIYAL
jgi:hypothetical protein